MIDMYGVYRDFVNDPCLGIGKMKGYTGSATFWITLMNGSRLDHVNKDEITNYLTHILPLEFFD